MISDCVLTRLGTIGYLFGCVHSLDGFTELSPWFILGLQANDCVDGSPRFICGGRLMNGSPLSIASCLYAGIASASPVSSNVGKTSSGPLCLACFLQEEEAYT